MFGNLKIAHRLLDDLVPSISKTAALVQEIAAASGEQARGTAQTTQQNASASEELAATAEEMNGQAEQRKQLMGRFRLAFGDGGIGPNNRKEA